jgi:hypothetical protein
VKAEKILKNRKLKSHDQAISGSRRPSIPFYSKYPEINGSYGCLRCGVGRPAYHHRPGENRGGASSDQFFFSESTWKNSKGREEFFIALDDNGGRAWARLHSDITKESAVWLPRKPGEIMNNDVIRFMRTLRNMFKDSSRHAMRGMFVFGKRKLAAEAAEFKFSQDEELKFGHARAFNVLTFDTTGSPDIKGRVVTNFNGALHYRKVTIYLPDDEIEVTLEERKEK